MIFTVFGYSFIVSAMRETGNASTKPYHHGDLSRALVDAARRILEAEGPQALSLRAVAREAGVSPAAPYHHFKDKGELLKAIAHEGWDQLGEQMRQALDEAKTADERRTSMGLAYVKFAQANPALYRVMGDVNRSYDDHDSKDMKDDESSAYSFVHRSIAAGSHGQASPLDVELATIAAWCAAHGLAELSSFPQFQRLKAELGGEEAFIRAVLDHLGMFAKSQH